jgi:GT2 family glycosyltransferase
MDKKITVVIPIHELSEDDFSFVTPMIESINSQRVKDFKVAFVVTEAVSDELKEKLTSAIDESIEVKVVVNTEETDYQSQVNFFATEHLDTPYFAVLQYDDILLDNYIMNAVKHIDAYPEHDMFVQIIFEIDNKNTFIGFSNEAVWSVGHMEEFGEFDLSKTKKHHFYNYNICGAIIKSVSFIDSGGFKPSMKKFHDYEFLLRMLEMGNKLYVIPKLTYKHVNGRVGSIFDSLQDMSKDEEKFWYDLAKKEYHFDYDRKIQYEQT